MDKLREGTPAITVGGEPLEDHLEREKGKEKQDETEASRKQEIVTKSKHKKKFRPRERFEDDPARVSKRVRRMSDFEIRREYGVKNKPYPTLNQNVLFVLFNSGKTLINSKAISDEVGKSLADVSSALSHIWKKLKDEGMIVRERKGLAYHYRLRDRALSLGFEGLYQKFWKGTVRKEREEFVPGKRRGPYAHYELKYKRTSKNVIDLISQTMGEEFSAREIANGVGKPPANISSTLQMVIRRLTPHNMLILTGSRATRLYRLHRDLAGIDGKDLIEFIQSPRKHYEKTLAHAWNFWRSRGFGVDVKPPEPKPVIPPPPDPAEKVTVTAAQVTQLVEPLLQRIQALEGDGLEDKVLALTVKTDEMAQAFNNFIGAAKTLHETVEEITEEAVATPNEFTINLRFLLGRA